MGFLPGRSLQEINIAAGVNDSTPLFFPKGWKLGCSQPQ
jgi:hypothetical protein